MEQTIKFSVEAEFGGYFSDEEERLSVQEELAEYTKNTLERYIQQEIVGYDKEVNVKINHYAK